MNSPAVPPSLMQRHPLIGIPTYAPFVYEVVFSVFPTLPKQFGLPSGGHSDQVPLLPFTNRQISERVRLSYYSPSTVCATIINTNFFIRQDLFEFITVVIGELAFSNAYGIISDTKDIERGFLMSKKWRNALLAIMTLLATFCCSVSAFATDAGASIAATGDQTYYIIGGIGAAALVALILFSLLGRKR